MVDGLAEATAPAKTTSGRFGEPSLQSVTEALRTQERGRRYNLRPLAMLAVSALYCEVATKNNGPALAGIVYGLVAPLTGVYGPPRVGDERRTPM
jgi:hypothetical protein